MWQAARTRKGRRTLHHVYGGVIYATPWRHHVAIPAVLTILLISWALAAFRRRPDTRAGRTALLAAIGAITLVPIVGVGFFEGVYNHLLKNLLYFGGATKLLREWPATAALSILIASMKVTTS